MTTTLSAARASLGDSGARHWLRTWTAAHKGGSVSPRRVEAAIPGPRAAGCRPLAPERGRETIAAAAAPALAPNRPRRVKRRASPPCGSGCGWGRLRRFGRPRTHLGAPRRSGRRLADDARNRRPDRLVRQERGARPSSRARTNERLDVVVIRGVAICGKRSPPTVEGSP